MPESSSTSLAPAAVPAAARAAPPPPPATVVVAFDRESITPLIVEGLANKEAGRPVEANDPVRIASISKLIMALTALRLADEGKVDAAVVDAALGARRVDAVVDRLLATGVWVILDLHHYTQLTGGTLHPREFAVDPRVVETRLVSLWRQIAWRYRHRSPRHAGASHHGRRADAVARQCFLRR